MQPSSFWLSADVPLSQSAACEVWCYICSWITECMKWWGVRLRTLLWSERREFKGPVAALSQLMKPLTPLTTWLPVGLFTIPLQLKGWICGYRVTAGWSLLNMSSQRSKHEITPRGDFFSQLSLRSVKSTEGRSRRDAGAAVSVNSSGLNICAWQVQ